MPWEKKNIPAGASQGFLDQGKWSRFFSNKILLISTRRLYLSAELGGQHNVGSGAASGKAIVLCIFNTWWRDVENITERSIS
jgi:hypothetical protein